MKQFLVKSLLVVSTALPALAQSVNTVIQPNPHLLAEPFGVAVDPDKGNIYLSDSANHAIYKFSTSGGLKLLAGSGLPDVFGPDDGTSLSDALFYSPQDILFLNGGLYVADQGNYAVRFINLTSGVVSTVAGSLGTPGSKEGYATMAQFRGPRGLAADASGNVYISDFIARTISKLDPSGTVTIITHAEDGLAGPSGLAVDDKTGQIYIADRKANRIKRREPDGTITLIAGTGAAGAEDSVDASTATFHFPDDVLWLGEEFGLMVSDSVNHILRRIYTNKVEQTYSVETYAGIAGNPGFKDDIRTAAQFNLPAGLSPYLTGFIVVDSGNQAVRQILTSPTPPRVNDPQIGWVQIVKDKDTGQDIAVLAPVTDATFENDVTIAILGDSDALNHYTSGASKTNIFQPDPIADPTLLSPTAPKFINGSSPSLIPQTIAQAMPALTVKALSTGRDPSEGRTPSQIVQATFRFQAATPSIDSLKVPGALVFTSSTTNAQMWYTLDGSEPTQAVNGTNANPNSLGPKANGDSIALVLGTNTVTVKLRAFRDNYKDSGIAIAEFSPTNFLPNRITFGFASGEASSDFQASAGQRFYAPVTLSLLPNAVMYGLQFNLGVSPDAGSTIATDYGLSFQSMLAQKIPTGTGVIVGGPPDAFNFAIIPPATLSGFLTNILVFTNVTVSSGGTTNTNIFTSTNLFPQFTNLLVTNVTENLLGVGWLERFGGTNLYDTRSQNLITYSLPHDNLFLGASGKVVPGGFSFVVPTNAVPGDSYTIQIGRPSATADGVSQDIFIQAPGPQDISPLKAIQKVEVANRTYIVGDVAPFRWFNAGDFGDTNILNNDLTQLMEAIAYGWNLPPPGSDFEDAMDTCCVKADGTDLSGSFQASDGNETTINEIAFGDGSLGGKAKLDIADLYVAFRRSLDPSLTWYARYWSNGVRQAVTVSNTFRLGAQSVKSLSAKALPIQGVPGTFSMQVFGAETLPGSTVQLPVRANVSGDFPAKAFMFNARVTTVDGSVPITEAVRFLPSLTLGAATVKYETSDKFAGAWLDTSRPGILGAAQLGVLQITIPTNATSASAYQIHLERVSASPNGIGTLPVETRDAFITMSDRGATGWSDEIPDSWRIKYFGSISNAQSAPELDPDGDGVPNLAEYRMGTSPTDPADFLKLVVAGSAGEGVRLRWPSAVGKRYILESSSTLGVPGWATIGSVLDGNGSVLEAVHQPGAGAQFYRVRLVP